MAGRFVAVGDSFTEGVGDPNVLYPNGVRGWADRVARQMGREDDAWEYANLAIRSKLLDEVVAEQLDAALALRPTLISFYAGGNDILSLRVDMESVVQRYEAALGRLTASGARVVVFTTFDMKVSSMLEPLRRRIRFFNNGVRELSRTYGAQLLDHTLLREYDDRRLWSADRIHMSKVGHKRLAGHVLDALGVPHTLKLPELPAWEPRTWRQAIAEERVFVRSEVIPLVRRRMRGVREGDSLHPKWPEPVHPADGLKKLARHRAAQLHSPA
ncbi:SGNH/GDSL hydrolase family protein [Luteipulveratus sp. YIM 133132]|uniref:SGNH/GDSL hydrolase family protein n=1 Tax=Luteipulveratus flavus TaxID=3031728 RepID=A0ABT6CAZ1_9MICO|nr:MULTISPECIES: SGNH/GDSL hydrolase family protein [unclassified Luteipulveratus]MDE9365589.1 SGNH/GDSL hydrolase family protein [Luteipulveratus sp. YIM 133132]MDF8265708.1 SGNH/GDSL hydrolase family protein [Luteipulveratus sp. YIM 133296]